MLSATNTHTNMSMPDVSIVILNWNTRDLLARCLQSVYETRDRFDVEVIVVDNASSDDSVPATRARFPQVKMIESRENTGFAKGNNRGVAASSAPFVLLLNSDAFLLPGALRSMLELAHAQPRAGMVGACLLNADGSFQASHTLFPNHWREFLILSGLGRMRHGRWYPSRGAQEEKGPQIVDYVEGACLLARRAAYAEVNGLDESFFMYAEEVDLCYRMRQCGWQVWYQPAAKVTHLGGGSSQNRRTQREVDLYRSRIHFFRKHYGGVSAAMLKCQIIATTAVKAILHGALFYISRGRRGRRVAPLRELVAL